MRLKYFEFEFWNLFGITCELELGISSNFFIQLQISKKPHTQEAKSVPQLLRYPVWSEKKYKKAPVPRR